MLRAAPFPVAALAAAGLAVAVAAPSGAQAAPHAIVAGPIPVHGYELSVMAIAGSPSLTVTLERDRGTTTQSHLYTVTTGVHATTKRIRAKLGVLGSIDLRLVPARPRRLPAGCRGAQQRVGTWTGSLRLVPDTTFFRTITVKRLPASVLKDENLGCDKPGAPTSSPGETGPQLATGGRGTTSLAADSTSTTVLATTRRGAAHVVHVLTVPSTLQTAADLTTATLTAKGSAVTGSATFAGSTSSATTVDGPVGLTATGTLSGTFTARFDSIGAVTVGPSVPALLELLPSA
jgi:hypothetical protein